MSEINLLCSLKDVDGIVQIEGIFHDTEEGLLENKQFKKPYPVIVLEWLEGGALFERIHQRSTVSESQLAKIFSNIIRALDSLHRRGYVHRDIKLENIILVNNEDDSPVKVIDLGLMVQLPDGSDEYTDRGVLGTAGCYAPESIEAYTYSPKTDLWQAGCVLYSLLSGLPPFHPDYPLQITNHTYYDMKGTGWDSISPSGKNLVAGLLEKNPTARLSCADVLNHPWIIHLAPEIDLGAEYFSRIKSLAHRQQLKSFFLMNNIQTTNRDRRERLKSVLPFLQSEAPCRNTAGEFEGKLRNMKNMVVRSLSPTKSGSSITSFQQGTLNIPSGKINYGTYVSLLLRSGLPELANPQVFNIFDISRNGYIDMKEFLLTMLAFKPSASEGGMDIDEREEAARLYFSVFDIDDSGTIDLHELRLVMGCLLQDDTLSPQLLEGTSPALAQHNAINIEELFDLIDVSHNGEIDFEEFKSFYDAVTVHPHHACSVDRAVCVHLGAELEPHALATPSNHNAVVNTSETLTDIFVLMGYDSCVKFVAFARLSSW
eukprot:CAMPEP_0185036004 /NCGR_PEP_ID=MMETSP1103-20130426/28324_1 /TAXON_ID=36769 /ORGANISM="Paraphysomonas bandaiensis, Strain Caron Lab Isolate" /LENGTH=542 /DNA_ID=CAMNT_0027573351 /DNA_START=166 /DNA_END=1792 /DNA_ORIENTATION=-